MKVSEYTLRLEHAGITNAGQEAMWLMSHALSVPHSEIFARKDFSPEEISRIEAVISRREAEEPLQYILGETEFYGRDFCVGHGVLIPRHDTETLIDAAKSCFARDESFSFVDWGTGSGCIAITLLLEFPNSHAYMLEASEEALSYAKRNISRYGLEARTCVNYNAASMFPPTRPHVRGVSVTQACRRDAPCRLVISNPPYIPSCELAGLMRSVRDYEPLSALDGGSDGMKCYGEVFSLARDLLQRDGYVILEAGSLEQVDALKALDGNFEFVGEVRDDGNFPRALIFRRD